MNDKNKNQEDQKELTIQEMLEQEGLPPFITRPKKEDIILWGCLIGITIISFALIPLRVWFLNNPEWYALIIGGYTSATLIGANSAVGGLERLICSSHTYWSNEIHTHILFHRKKMGKRLLRL